MRRRTRAPVGDDGQLWPFRGLIRLPDTRQLAEPASAGAGVEPLHVTLLTDRQWGRDMDLEEPASPMGRPDVPTVGAERGHERDQGDDTGVTEDPGEMSDTAHLRGPVIGGEAEDWAGR